MKIREPRNRLAILLIIFVLCGCVSEEARPYDRENKCWGEPEVVDTSFSLGGSSLGAMTYAEDEDGNFWHFSSTSLPSGFKETNNITEDIVYAPRCNDI